MRDDAEQPFSDPLSTVPNRPVRTTVLPVVLRMMTPPSFLTMTARPSPAQAISVRFVPDAYMLSTSMVTLRPSGA